MLKVAPAFDPRLYIRAAVGPQGEIDGYLAIYGSNAERDAYGTWFDKNNLPEMELNHLPIKVRYEHGQDGTVGKQPIGKVIKVWFDNIGVAFKGLLDKAHPYFERFVDEIKQGILATSTGTLGYLAEFDEEGRFKYWSVEEVSLTANPAEERMPSVAMVRSIDGKIKPFFKSPNKTFTPPQTPAKDATRSHSVESSDGVVVTNDNSKIRKPNMPPKRSLTLETLGVAPTATLEEVFTALIDAVGEDAAKAMVAGVIGAGADAPSGDGTPPGDMPPMQSGPEGRSMEVTELLKKMLASRSTPAPAPTVVPVTPAENAEIVKLRGEVDAMRKQMLDAPMNDEPTPLRSDRRTPPPAATVSEPRKFWHLSHNDLLFGHMVMRAHRIQPTEEYMRIMAGRSMTALEKGDKYLNDPAVRSVLPSIRANEIAISTAAGGGDEWVAIAWSAQVWEAARSNRIYEQLVAKGMRVEEVPQGHESIYVMTEGADPTVYTISQNADLSSGRPPVNVAATRIGTGRVLLTPGELGMAVVYSDVFEEDSLIPVLSQYNYQMGVKADETVEQLFLNGDTDPTASTNINLIDGTPGTGTSTPYYIASNGALKYALVTGSSTSRDGGALDENDYRLTMKLLPSAIRTRKQNLAFVIDPDTHNTSLNIAAIKTEDVRTSTATIKSGVLTNIYGVDVYESGFMLLANSSGKIPNAGGTLGRILAVYAPYWCAGWKRKIRIETDRDILSGDNIIVAKMRLGFVPRGAGASTVSYNLTIA